MAGPCATLCSASALHALQKCRFEVLKFWQVAADFCNGAATIKVTSLYMMTSIGCDVIHQWPVLSSFCPAFYPALKPGRRTAQWQISELSRGLDALPAVRIYPNAFPKSFGALRPVYSIPGGDKSMESHTESGCKEADRLRSLWLGSK